jgi:hypothetical protein
MIMQTTHRAFYPSWVFGPLGGAAAAIGLALVYALVFIVYATIRSALLILLIPSDAGVVGTVVAYAASLAVSALVIAALMMVPAALVGALTAALLKRVVSAFNPQHDEQRAILIGAGTCLILVTILHILFQRMLGFTLADVVANPETYLFWLAIPSLIYIVVGGAASWELNCSHA